MIAALALAVLAIVGFGISLILSVPCCCVAALVPFFAVGICRSSPSAITCVHLTGNVDLELRSTELASTDARVAWSKWAGDAAIAVGIGFLELLHELNASTSHIHPVFGHSNMLTPWIRSAAGGGLSSSLTLSAAGGGLSSNLNVSATGGGSASTCTTASACGCHWQALLVGRVYSSSGGCHWRALLGGGVNSSSSELDICSITTSLSIHCIGCSTTAPSNYVC